MDKLVALTTAPADHEDLRSAIRAVIDQPRFDEVTIVQLVGTLEILKQEFFDRLRAMPDS